MDRKITAYLDAWIANPFRKPLLIHGARQVGKTYAVKELFAKRYFPNRFIYIDFRRDEDVRRYVKNHPDAKAIIDYLTLRERREIGKDTLLIFDEAQEAVQILTAAKYFAQDFPQIPVIITGSLVRLRLKQVETGGPKGGIRLDPEILPEHQDGHNNFLYPVGKVDQIDLYPLTFDEFLLSYNPRLYGVVKSSTEQETPLDGGVHEMALEAFGIYLQIGGLPEVVDIYLQTGSVMQARRKIETLFSDYLADMSLYQVSSQTIARTKMVWNSIYAQLSKENKNFKISEIERGKRFRDYYAPFDWLELSRLILKSHPIKERVTSPLIPSDESLFRVYLPDCGLFALEAKIDLHDFLPSLKRNTLSGPFFENYVAEELTARGIPLFYWKGKTSSELEFLLDTPEGLIPIDAKKTRGDMPSLDIFKKTNSYLYAIKASSGRIGFDPNNRIKTLPFYSLPFYLDIHFGSPYLPKD